MLFDVQFSKSHLTMSDIPVEYHNKLQGSLVIRSKIDGMYPIMQCPLLERCVESDMVYRHMETNEEGFKRRLRQPVPLASEDAKR